MTPPRMMSCPPPCMIWQMWRWRVAGRVFGEPEKGGGGTVWLCSLAAGCLHSSSYAIWTPAPGYVWCRLDLGTADELALDVLINMLRTFSKEQLGIRQLLIGGSSVEGWSVPEHQGPDTTMDPMRGPIYMDGYEDDDNDDDE
jgi:hypothetical protein